MKKLSVVIPVYNEERTIGEILKCVYDIPLDGWEKEILVVDDGSTDKTRFVLKAWEKRVHVHYKKK
jgi:glycosyltransferase involved in cell wall biosynthesis